MRSREGKGTLVLIRLPVSGPGQQAESLTGRKAA
jgi:hypothetical protein